MKVKERHIKALVERREEARLIDATTDAIFKRTALVRTHCEIAERLNRMLNRAERRALNLEYPDP